MKKGPENFSAAPTCFQYAAWQKLSEMGLLIITDKKQSISTEAGEKTETPSNNTKTPRKRRI